MKNSIRAILAMFAILPCALFFTACGGEKISTEQANTAFASAITETGKVSTDYKIDLDLAYTDVLSNTTVKAVGAVVKTGEITKTGDTVNFDAVKSSANATVTTKVGKSAEVKTAFGYVVAKGTDGFVIVDTIKEAYTSVPEEYTQLIGMDLAGSIQSLIEAISSSIGGGDEGSTSGIDIETDFDLATLTTDTMKLTAEKNGDGNYTLTLKGYEIDEDNYQKTEGKVVIKIKDGKFASMSVDMTIYTTEDTGADLTKAKSYNKKVTTVEGSVSMTYGAQTVVVPDYSGYTNEFVMPEIPSLPLF